MTAGHPTTDPLGLTRYLLDDDTAAWAAAFLRTLAEGRPVPVYGSPGWLAEPDYRLQIAAAVRAGEAWRRDGLLLGHELPRQDLALRAAVDAAEFAVIAARVRDLARRPSHAELVARRRVVAA